MKILHCASELFPYVKVGGLGDVMAALPGAQRALGADARLLLPGFGPLLKGIQGLEVKGGFPDLLGQGEARLLLGAQLHRGLEAREAPGGAAIPEFRRCEGRGL